MIWNIEAETMALADRRLLQLARLRETLRWAIERVPLYREHVAAAPVRGLEDLCTLPFTRNTDLREHYPFGAPKAKPCG